MREPDATRLLPEQAHRAAQLYLAEEGHDTAPDDGSELSEAVSLSDPTPDVPRLTANRTATKGVVRLRWAESAGATSYSLYRGAAVNPTVLLEADLTVGKYDDVPGADGTYHYRVTASVDGDEGDYSNDVTVKVRQ